MAATEKISARVRFEDALKSPVAVKDQERQYAHHNPLLSEDSSNKYILTSDERNKAEPPQSRYPEKKEVIQPYRREEPPKYDRYSEQLRTEPSTTQVQNKPKDSVDRYGVSQDRALINSSDIYRRDPPLGLNTVKNSPSQNRRLDDNDKYYDKYTHHAPSVSYGGKD